MPTEQVLREFEAYRQKELTRAAGMMLNLFQANSGGSPPTPARKAIADSRPTTFRLLNTLLKAIGWRLVRSITPLGRDSWLLDGGSWSARIEARESSSLTIWTCTFLRPKKPLRGSRRSATTRKLR